MSEPRRYLLDTSAVIDLPTPAQITTDAEYLISSITLAELNAGIHAAQGPVLGCVEGGGKGSHEKSTAPGGRSTTLKSGAKDPPADAAEVIEIQTGHPVIPRLPPPPSPCSTSRA